MNERQGLGRSIFAIGALSVCALTSTAMAQQQGTYVGQTKDGHSVSFTVGYDSGTGNYNVTGGTVYTMPLCQKTKESFEEEWIFNFGSNVDIIDGKWSYTIAYHVDFLPLHMTFKGKKSLSGTISVTEADFNPASNYSTRPTKEQFCVFKQPFTASYQGPNALTLLESGKVKIERPDSQTVITLPNTN